MAFRKLFGLKPKKSGADKPRESEGQNDAPARTTATVMAMEKEQTQSRLDSDPWHKAEVDYVLEKDVVLDARDELRIKETNVPVIMLARHLAKVGELWLWDCTVSKRGGGGQPLPHPTLHYLRLYSVTGVRDLLRAEITLPSVTKLRLWNCPGVRLFDLTASRTFPGLRSLELWEMSGEELDGQLPPTVRELKLDLCGRVEWGRCQSVGCHLQQLGVEGSTLVLGDRGGHVTPWHSLQELRLGWTHVETAKGDRLYTRCSGDFSRVREWLADRCPQAEVTIDFKVIQESRLKRQLMEPEMQEVYQEACLEGTQEVYRSRLILIGHYSAGKTSLKRNLMHQPFKETLESTIGVETADQTCVVDVETAVDWKKETLQHKEEFKQNVASGLHGRIIAGSKGASRQDATKPAPPEPSTSADEATAATDIPAAKKVSASEKGRKSSGPLDVMPAEMAGFVRDMKAEIFDITSAMSLKDEGGKKAVFVIWDFGGQQLYYTTHQTFLSRTSFYVIVMDISRGLDDVIEATEQHSMWKDSGSPRTSRDFLDFWLKSVHTHLIHREPRDSQLVSPPVIIVCTKKDLLGKDENVRTAKVKQYIQSIRDHLEGKPYYRHVHDIIAISNCEAGDPEVDRLRHVIVDVSKKQPYWGEKRPLKWLLLADMLIDEGASRSEDPVLKLEDVVSIAQEFEVTREQLSAFLEFYHNLGDLVYFDEAGTNDVVVLSPQWLANMFSKVITHHHTEGMTGLTVGEKKMLKQGMLSTEAAAKLPQVAHPQMLIKIMEKFDMLVSCNVTTGASTPSPVYLVPCLLQRVKEYQIVPMDPKIPSIHFKCIPTTELGSFSLQEQGFLPPGLFHRLVSDCCTVTRWQHQQEMIFFDYMMFDAGDFCFTLHMVHNGITLSAFEFSGDPLKYSLALNELKEDIQSRIEKILDQVFPNLLCTTFLSCNCFSEPRGASSPPAEVAAVPGFIPVKHLSELERRTACPEHRRLLILRKYQIWFGVDSTALDVSKLSVIGHELLTQLQPHVATLLSSWSYKVRDIMMDKEVLTFLEVKDIKAEPTTYAQNFKMYDIIFHKVQTTEQARSVEQAICEGLCQSSQVCPFSKEHQPATADQQDELRRLRPSLMEMSQSDLSEVLKELQEKGILDYHLREEMDVYKTKRDRMHILLAFISRTHSDAQKEFLDILKDSLWGKCQFGDSADTS